jgi:hypothetical protein
MDAKAYCHSVGVELAGWKAKLYDIIRKTESMTAEDKEKAGPALAALHAIVDDLNQRIEWLSRECPTDWAGPKEEIENTICQLKDKWKSVWGIMGEEEYGIGGA